MTAENQILTESACGIVLLLRECGVAAVLAKEVSA
jgi:hypothetical protein